MGCAQSRRSNCLGGGGGTAGGVTGVSGAVPRERDLGVVGGLRDQQGGKLPSFDTAVTAGPSELHKHHDHASSGGPSALLSSASYGHRRKPSREEPRGTGDDLEGTRYGGQEGGGGDAESGRAPTATVGLFFVCSPAAPVFPDRSVCAFCFLNSFFLFFFEVFVFLNLYEHRPAKARWLTDSSVLLLRQAGRDVFYAFASLQSGRKVGTRRQRRGRRILHVETHAATRAISSMESQQTGSQRESACD